MSLRASAEIPCRREAGEPYIKQDTGGRHTTPEQGSEGTGRSNPRSALEKLFLFSAIRLPRRVGLKTDESTNGVFGFLPAKSSAIRRIVPRGMVRCASTLHTDAYANDHHYRRYTVGSSPARHG